MKVRAEFESEPGHVSVQIYCNAVHGVTVREVELSEEAASSAFHVHNKDTFIVHVLGCEVATDYPDSESDITRPGDVLHIPSGLPHRPRILGDWAYAIVFEIEGNSRPRSLQMQK
ncbi:Cupin domain protein [Thalassoglobus neptunius]|uniref:Cupin domain protein n=1 Tax=Thalassoglobus neptunius TaxID=1938619 RepID=A0A5C5VTP3_9PLAN|nr:cupin domain-containing protein [Thalassoglobus neptunius]TWT41507.1 Cupin domain protein [Thalassoglobus neptunius]